MTKTYQARVARTMIRGRLAYQIDGQVTIFVPTIVAHTVAALLKDA